MVGEEFSAISRPQGKEERMHVSCPELIEKLTTYYGLAIRNNIDSLENMKNAIWATFYHKSSTDEKPQHCYCSYGEKT